MKSIQDENLVMNNQYQHQTCFTKQNLVIGIEFLKYIDDDKSNF